MSHREPELLAKHKLVMTGGGKKQVHICDVSTWDDDSPQVQHGISGMLQVTSRYTPSKAVKDFPRFRLTLSAKADAAQVLPFLNNLRRNKQVRYGHTIFPCRFVDVSVGPTVFAVASDQLHSTVRCCLLYQVDYNSSINININTYLVLVHHINSEGTHNSSSIESVVQRVYSRVGYKYLQSFGAEVKVYQVQSARSRECFTSDHYDSHCFQY